MTDKNGQTILVGDTLVSDFGYKVTVVEHDGELVGKLVCEPGHSCENIPYSLNDGFGHSRERGL